MKILIVGDSIGLPRFHYRTDEIEAFYDDTYPERLRQFARFRYPQEDVHVLNRCAHANTSWILRNGAANEALFFRPDFLVIELGMADLWPRDGQYYAPPYPELAGHNPWTSEEEFDANFSRFLDFCSTISGLQVILVSIPRASAEQYGRHKGALERTHQYNAILRRNSGRPCTAFVDAFQIADELGEAAYGTDGIHPSNLASRFLAERLLHAITRIRQLEDEKLAEARQEAM